MEISLIREKHEALFTEAKAIASRAESEKRGLTSDEKSRLDSLYAGMDETKRDFENLQNRAAEAFAAEAEVNGFARNGLPRSADEFNHFSPTSGAVKPLTNRESFAKAINAKRCDFGIGDYCRAMVLGARSQAEQFALSEGTDSAGGYTVPAYLSARAIDSLRGESVFLKAGAVTVPLLGYQNKVAKISADPTLAWKAENAAATTADLTFDGLTFVPKTLTVIVRASRELLEDSLNVNEAINMAFAGAFAAELDRVCGWGSGSSNEPLGILGTSGILFVAATNANGDTLTSYSKFLDALYQLQNNNAVPNGVVMSPREAKTVNGLADSTGQPLRKPDALAAMPFYVSARVPVNQTQGTSSIASSMIMGDFSRLWIGIRSALRIEVLRERYADNLQYGFLAYLRADVAVTHNKAFCKISGIIP